jgi:hypothetical protein
LAFISLTKSDKALFGFKPIKYEHGLAFHWLHQFLTFICNDTSDIFE